MDLHIRDRHRLMTGAVGPRPICWASTVDADGRPNLAPYSFFNMFSANPPILVFSSNRRGRDNTTKDTLHNIEATGEVVINVVSHELVYQMNICSTDYAADVDEFVKSGVTPVASDTVRPARVGESPVQFECTVDDIIHLGDEGGAGNLFLCRVRRMHVDESILADDGLIDAHRIRLVGRLGRSEYSAAFEDAVFSIDNPFTRINLGFDGLPEAIRQSPFLTGNLLARLAMETELPSDDEISAERVVNETFLGDEETVCAEAAARIERDDVRSALILLMTHMQSTT